MDNQKYYYIKMKDSYFEQDNIKVLESLPNGHIFSLILIKMYLKASKYNGQLMMTSSIPYDPNNLEILANVLNHDVSHVRDAIRAGLKLDLVTIIDGREIWLTEIQNMIGRSSTEADRIRKYRMKLDDKMLLESDEDSEEKEEEVNEEVDKEELPEKVEEPKSKEYYDAKLLCKLMELLHKKHDSKYKANINPWIRHVELLMRVDNRSVSEIEKVIRWVKNPDNFWFSNIMSGKKLRQQFPALVAKMQRETAIQNEKTKDVNGAMSLEDIAKKYDIRGE